jgi:hypothetical protein
MKKPNCSVSHFAVRISRSSTARGMQWAVGRILSSHGMGRQDVPNPRHHIPRRTPVNSEGRSFGGRERTYRVKVLGIEVPKFRRIHSMAKTFLSRVESGRSWMCDI